MAMLLDALGVPRQGLMARLSSQLASWMLQGKHANQIITQGSLSGAVALIPIYPPKKSWLPPGSSLERMPDAASRDLARLSLVALLATWRAGGVAAPVTPELLDPPRDREGRLLTDPEWRRCEVPALLQQWRPDFVLSFGALDEVFLRTASNRRTPWSVRVPHVRLKLEADRRPRGIQFPGPGFRNDSSLDPTEVAISFCGGEEITFADLLSAVADPAGNMPCSSEGAAGIVRLLRMARERSSSSIRPRERPWWELQGQENFFGPWPPKRLPKLQTMWVAVDAADPSRQGRTLDGHVYFWNRESNETTWTSPWGGRRSQQRVKSRLQEVYGSSSEGPRMMRTSGSRLGRSSAGNQQFPHARVGLVLEYMNPFGRKLAAPVPQARESRETL
ncbi:unnamed protein product [Symbiodinium pilosum]|uniref:WW domain-containing protein n=1 Tax=Symbiodinium pilosum TaxID=2952 RepID=A0A812WXS1_SYMPI|nr:unnamed protein product [Symbiodinium pilosum]